VSVEFPPEGWWVMPRRLAHELEDGNLKPGEFLLLSYLGAAGLGHWGVSTTNSQLAAVMNVNERSIRRYLQALGEHGWIRYPSHQGSHRPFRILPGERLTSDSTSDTTSDTARTPGVRSSHDVVRSREADEAPSAPSFAPRANPPAVRSDKEEDDEETQPSVSKETAELHTSTPDVETDDDALLAALGLGSAEREVLAALALEFPGTLAYWRDERGVRVQRVEELGG